VTTTLKRGLAALTAIVLTFLGIAAATPASATQTGTATMTGIRTGLNTGFDRIVLDMTGAQPGVSYTNYLDELIADGSGEIVWLTGQYFVSVVANPARAHDDAGNPTYTGPQKFRTRNLRNVMAVAVTGDFEGYLSIGLGIRYQSWVRVFTLGSPTRVVIDVGN
jgi:hypothetical protein